MDSILDVLLPKSSMNAMEGTRPWSVLIMPVWIVWILPNVMAADGIQWWRRRGCGDGWNYMAVTHKMVVL